jgi:hypothetical protein
MNAREEAEYNVTEWRNAGNTVRNSISDRITITSQRFFIALRSLLHHFAIAARSLFNRYGITLQPRRSRFAITQQ